MAAVRDTRTHAAGEAGAGGAAGGFDAAAADPIYDSPDLYDLMYETFAFDTGFWTTVAKSAGGPVLEIACGTGRILLRLMAEGVDADGIDSYAPMLQRLQAKARERGLTPRVWQADMRDFTLPRRYARVLCPFNAFAHCASTDDQIRALRCMREHLEPGGALVLHMSYPGAALWTSPEGDPVLELETTHPLNGNALQVWDTRWKDPVNQSQRSIVEIRELGADGAVVETQRVETVQRWVYRWELELLLAAAGFAACELFGGFEGEPLEHDDQQIVAWAWRA